MTMVNTPDWPGWKKEVTFVCKTVISHRKNREGGVYCKICSMEKEDKERIKKAEMKGKKKMEKIHNLIKVSSAIQKYILCKIKYLV